MQLLDRLREAAHKAFERLDKATGGAAGVIKQTVKRFGEENSSQWAASLAYYIFFSLFPLMLVLVGVATFAFSLNSEQASQEAVRIITEAIPIQQGLVADTLDTVVELRGTITSVGFIGLLWSASSAFATLSHSINQAFDMAEPRSFIQKRLVALGMVMGAIILLVLSLMSSTILDMLTGADLFGLDLSFLTGPLGLLLTRLAPLLISFIVFIVLYRWVPTEHVTWKAVLWGAGFAAVGWEIAKWLFSWYMRSGLTDYGVVYGSLSGVVILLFWIYVSSVIILMGAHLASVLDPDGEQEDESETDARKLAGMQAVPASVPVEEKRRP